MFKAESGSPRSSSTKTTAAAPEGRADRANGRATAASDIGFVGLGPQGNQITNARAIPRSEEFFQKPLSNVF
jgi:hypothetical protein